MKMIEPTELKVLSNNVPLQYPTWNEEGDYPLGEYVSWAGYVYKATWNPELNPSWQQRNVDRCPSLYSEVSLNMYTKHTSVDSYDQGDIVAYVTNATVTNKMAVNKNGDVVTVNVISAKLYEAVNDVPAYTGITNTDFWRETVPFWELVGVENSSAALYDYDLAQSYLNNLSSVMTSSSTIILEFDTSKTSRLALFGMYGTDLTVTFYKYVSPDYVEEQTYARKLYSRPYINGMMSWLFGGFEYTNQQDIITFPHYKKSKIRVEITPRSGVAKLALACVGNERYLGSTKYGTSMSLEDYSKNEINSLGMRTVKEGAYKYSHTVPVNINRSQIDFVRNILTRFRATPAVYISMDGIKSAIIFGYYKNMTITRDGWKKSSLSITITEQ